MRTSHERRGDRVALVMVGAVRDAPEPQRSKRVA
jgi:hypothetical protein